MELPNQRYRLIRSVLISSGNPLDEITLLFILNDTARSHLRLICSHPTLRIEIDDVLIVRRRNGIIVNFPRRKFQPLFKCFDRLRQKIFLLNLHLLPICGKMIVHLLIGHCREYHSIHLFKIHNLLLVIQIYIYKIRKGRPEERPADVGLPKPITFSPISTSVPAGCGFAR